MSADDTLHYEDKGEAGEELLQGRGRPANCRKGRKQELGHNSKHLFYEFSGIFRSISFCNSLTKKELPGLLT